MERLSTPEGRAEFAEDMSKALLQVGSALVGSAIGAAIVATAPISFPVLGGGLALVGVGFLAKTAFNAMAASEGGEFDAKRFVGKTMKDIGEAMIACTMGIAWGGLSVSAFSIMDSKGLEHTIGRKEVSAMLAETGDPFTHQVEDFETYFSFRTAMHG